jgi:hypothetical protein
MMTQSAQDQVAQAIRKADWLKAEARWYAPGRLL